MKSRWFLFLFGFVLGVAAGFGLAREETRAQLTSTLSRFASQADQRLRELLPSMAPDPESASPAGPPVPPPSVPSRPPPPDKTRYIRESLLLLGVQAQMDPSLGNVAIIRGQVQNSGDQTLQSVSVTVYFMGETDIIFDKNIPILGESVLGGKKERKFEVRVTDVPERWTGGRVRTAITDIEFAN
jgi:hypothetical protein